MQLGHSHPIDSRIEPVLKQALCLAQRLAFETYTKTCTQCCKESNDASLYFWIEKDGDSRYEGHLESKECFAIKNIY